MPGATHCAPRDKDVQELAAAPNGTVQHRAYVERRMRTGLKITLYGIFAPSLQATARLATRLAKPRQPPGREGPRGCVRSRASASGSVTRSGSLRSRYNQAHAWQLAGPPASNHAKLNESMIASPWGPLAVSDAHVHFFSHGFFSGLAAQVGGATVESIGQTLGWSMPPQDPEQLAAAWVQELDRHGVERAVLIASAPGDEDSVAAAVAVQPRRFYGYFMVNPLSEDAVARTQGALDRGGLHGVCLFPAMHRYFLHSTPALAILDVVQATRPRTVVFVHCGALTVASAINSGCPRPSTCDTRIRSICMRWRCGIHNFGLCCRTSRRIPSRGADARGPLS